MSCNPKLGCIALRQTSKHLSVWLFSHSGAALWMSLDQETHAAPADATGVSTHGTSTLKADMLGHSGQPASQVPNSNMKAEASDPVSGQAAMGDTDISMDKAPPLAEERLPDGDEPSNSAQLGVAKRRVAIKEEDSEFGGSAGVRSRVFIVAGSHLKIWMSTFETVCARDRCLSTQCMFA